MYEDKHFNIVIFQIGDFYNRATLYNNCIKSIREEFPNDNIMIFHSLEEIEEKYYIPHNEYYDKFVKQQDIMAILDYVRVYLTNYISDMIYIDSDIMVYSGFRNYLIKKINENKKYVFIRFQLGTSLFYCKEKSEKINDFIKYFTSYIIKKNIYIPDVTFKSYLDNVPFPYCNPNAIKKFIEHNVCYTFLINKFSQIVSDYKFVTIYEQIHCIPTLKDLRFNNNALKINIVDDDVFENIAYIPNLNYLPNCLDITNEWYVVKKSFYFNCVINDYLLKNNKVDIIILANLYEDNTLNDIYNFYDKIKQKRDLENKNYKIFLLKKYKKEEIIYPIPREINIVNSSDWDLDIFNKMANRVFYYTSNIKNIL